MDSIAPHQKKKVIENSQSNASDQWSGFSEENVFHPPLSITSQQINDIILGSGHTVEHSADVTQQPLRSESTALPTAIDNAVPERQQYSANSGQPPIQPVISNNANNINIYINSTLNMLLHQNQILINRLLERDNSSVRNVSPFETNPDGFFVMPDFHNTVPNFSGSETKAQARDWLQSVQSVARLHHWPEAFKLEKVRTKLVAAASNWLCGRNFTTWGMFEKQFMSTFADSSTSVVGCMKLLLSRIQNKNESHIEYFHDKARLCREVKLSFAETKQQIIEGLHCRDLFLYLLAHDHADEDALLSDILSFNTMNTARYAHFKTDLRPHSNSESPSSSQKPRTAKIITSTGKQSSSVNTSATVIRCFNCSSFGHFAALCTKPKRESGSCFKCGLTSHQLRQCPSASTNNKEALVLQSPLDIVNSAYTIKLDLKFLSDEVVNVLAIVDTGSPVSLLRQNKVPSWSPPNVSPLMSGLVGINGSELIMLDQMFVDVLTPGDDCPINVSINIFPDSTIKCDLLLGRNFLSHPRVVINIHGGSFEIDFKRSDIIPFDEILSIEIEQDSKNSEINLNVEETLPSYVRTEVENIVTDSYFNNNHLPSEPMAIDASELEIHLKDSSVFHFKPRRLSYYEKDKLQKILDDLLARNIIKPSSFEYSSPIVLIKEKNGELRLCVDYRELNKPHD